MAEITAELNRLAGTTGLEAAGAANAFAGTTGLDIVGALNMAIGRTSPATWLDLGGVCNLLAGTTGLEPAGALAQVQAKNMLTANQASIETDLTGLTGIGATPTRLVTSGAYVGGAVLQLVSTVNGTVRGGTVTGVSGVPVTPGATYSALAAFRTTSATSRTGAVRLYWYTSGGSASTTPYSAATMGTPATGAWSAAHVAAVAPADAAFAAVNVAVSAALIGETFEVDQFGLFKGTRAVWSAP